MIHLIYNFSIYLYSILTKIAAIWNDKAKKRILGIKDLHQLYKNPKPIQPVIWFHCASLGEFEQGRTIIELYRKNHPEHFLLLTFFSSSGYEAKKNYPIVDLVTYLPFDIPSQAQDFITYFNPKIGIIIKYELWWNIIEKAKESNCKLYLVSAKLSPSFYNRLINRKILSFFDTIFCQDKITEKICLDAGCINVLVEKDTRYDRVFEISKSSYENEIIENFINNKPVIIAGSVWLKDVLILSEAFKNPKLSQYQWIIAPHEIDPENLEEIKKTISINSCFYSKTETGSRVLIIDNIGMLSKIYRYAHICFIGGGFDNGIHNTLEAAAYGKPIIFGPKFSNFIEAKLLIKNNAGFSIKNSSEFEKIILELTENILKYKNACKNSTELVINNLGASFRILNTINN